jgi:polyhydroxybutyrate depolymerase
MNLLRHSNVAMFLFVALAGAAVACGGGGKAAAPAAAAADGGDPAATDEANGAPAATDQPAAPAAPAAPVAPVTPAGAVNSAGCGLAAATPGFVAGKVIDIAGVQRNYDIFVPPGYDGKSPRSVIFALHSEAGEDIRQAFQIEQAAAGKAIVVYPKAFSAWDLSATTSNYDFPFIEALLTSIQQTYCVDKTRIFAFGHSNAAYFINMQSCFRKPVYRAISVSGGSIYAPEGQAVAYDDGGHVTCPATAALIIHGQSDAVVSYTDGVYGRDTWAAMDKCSTATAPSPAGTSCVSYTSCAAKPVTFCGINADHSIWNEAATASWKFFSAQ